MNHLLPGRGHLPMHCSSNTTGENTAVFFGLSGEKRLANQIHYKLYDYYGPLYAQGNPVGVKACLELLGICKAIVRPPLVEATDEIKIRIKRLSARYSQYVY